jgi:hypothetical protein
MTQISVPEEAAIPFGEWILRGAAQDIYGWLRACHWILPEGELIDLEKQLFGNPLSSAEQDHIKTLADPKRVRLTRN